MLIDWFTVGAQILNFLVLVWLLRRFLYRPVLNALDKREEMIRKQIQEAEQQTDAATQEREQYLELQQSWEQKKASMLEAAEDTATQHRKRLVDEAREEAAALRHRLEQSMREEHEQLQQEILLRTQQEVFAISRKVLKDLASSSLEEHMVQAFLRKLNELRPDEEAKLVQMIQNARGEVVVRSAYELPVGLQKRVRDYIGNLVSGESLRFSFETAPDKISGIEILAGGYKLAWSVTDHLSSLELKLSQLLDEHIPPLNPQSLSHEPANG